MKEWIEVTSTSICAGFSLMIFALFLYLIVYQDEKIKIQDLIIKAMHVKIDYAVDSQVAATQALYRVCAEVEDRFIVETEMSDHIIPIAKIKYMKRQWKKDNKFVYQPEVGN